MTDGAQRIADFMGDAGGQATQGGQFQLLRLLRDLREILEKDQGLVVGALIQGDEARLQFQAVAGDLQLWGAGSGCSATVAGARPMPANSRQSNGLRDARNPAGQGAVVGELHSALLVEHQYAGAHPLQDQRIEGFRPMTSLAFCSARVSLTSRRRVRPCTNNAAAKHRAQGLLPASNRWDWKGG
jgi:hypothetical protein